MAHLDFRQLLRQIFVTGWDRFITYSCFIAYGAWSLLRESNEGTAQAAFDPFWGFLFNVELVVAGTLLMVSLIRDSLWIRWLGFGIFFIGMVTVAGLIIVGPGTPTGVLVFGLAMQGLISLRNVSKARAVNLELLELSAELEKRRDGRGS